MKTYTCEITATVLFDVEASSTAGALKESKQYADMLRRGAEAGDLFALYSGLVKAKPRASVKVVSERERS